MKHLFRIVLSAAVVAAMTLACKKEQPEPKKDTTFVLEATVSGEAKYDGSGDLSYTEKSTKKTGDKEEFVPWTMEFSMDGGNTWKAEKPEFLTLTTKEENGDLTAKTYTATFAAQEKTLQTSDIILKAREVKNNVDLSMVDIKGNTLAGGQSTANCYVIHNPGTYKFPTVYGNSIKNGQNNEKAYKSSKTGNPNILENFIKADGNPITQPQIENINNACLIWQDTKDLISNISYNANYVSFEVKKETIHNGNAIIAVRDASNTILWSWHIWVTEEDLTPVEITNHNNINYSILPVNLGWCGLGTATDYAPREVKIRIKQQSGNKTVDLAFNQKGHFIERDKKIGNCTFYQWGRKDPMLPSNGTADNTDKDCFPGEDQYQFAYKGHGEGLNTDDIKEYIRNPHKYNIKHEMDNRYYNLWSTDNDKTDANDDVVLKTVYDPSPVGYSLPASNAFTGFTTTGQNSENASEFNVEGDFAKGWLFYTKPNKAGTTMFFPASGYRLNSSGSLSYVTTSGFYWVAGPLDSDGGRYFYFSSDYVYPLINAIRSFGLSVRCAAEKQ